MQYADVLVDHKISRKSFLTYAISSEQLSYIDVGSVVLVPFGKATIHGVIVKLHRGIDPSLRMRLKPIKSVIYPNGFVPNYLIKAVISLEKKWGFPAAETLFRLLPKIPKRPQSMIAHKGSNIRRSYQTYAYQLSGIKRILLYMGIWKRVKTHDQSLIILCASQDSVKATAQALEDKRLPIYLYPEVSNAKQRNYYLHSLASPEPKIYIGTRGALTTSLVHVGAVIVDEPWLPGHKDDRSPRYWTSFILSELCHSQSIPLFLVSSFIWPEDLLFKPKIKQSKAKFGQTHLLIDRSHGELDSELQNIFTNNEGRTQAIYNPVAQSQYWCKTCQKPLNSDHCSICKLPTKAFSIWRKEDIDHALSNSNPIAMYSLLHLALLKPSDTIITFGLDALLAITDYRSSLYLSTLLSYMRERSKILYLVTRNPDAWTSIIRFMDTYNLEGELHLRQNHNLPPFSIAIRLQHQSKAKVEAFYTKIKTATKYRGTWQNRGKEYSLFLLIDPKQRHILHTSDKNGIVVDIFPNYIDSS